MTRIYGQEYFYVISVNGRKMEVLKSWDYGHEPETERFATGNYFRSEEAALNAVNNIRRVLERLI